MKKIIFFTLMSLMFLFVSANDLFACSCVASPNSVKQQVKDSYKNSAAIFSGEIVSITPKDEWTVNIKIKVTKFWKGSALSNEIIITTSKESAMCGYNFEVGKKYLVYATGTKENLSTTNCSRTAIFGDKQEIKFLDRLKKTKGKSA